MLEDYSFDKFLLDYDNNFKKELKCLENNKILTFILKNGEVKKVNCNDYAKYDGNAFSDFSKKDVVKIIIPDGIKIIQSDLFGFSNLEEVVLPEELEEIGDYTFYGCSNLKRIRFPKSLKFIGVEAFYKCKSLKEIKLFNVSNLRNNAFSYSGLQKVIIMGNIKEISYNCFYNCLDWKSFMLPAGCLYGGWRCFLENDYDEIKQTLLEEESDVTLFCNNYVELVDQLQKICSILKDIYFNSESDVNNFFKFRSNFTLRIQEDNLSVVEKIKVKKFLANYKLGKVVFISKNKLVKELGVEEELEKDNNIGLETINIGEENQKLVDEISKLVESISSHDKENILSMVNRAIDRYKVDLEKEKPTLDLDDDNIFSFNDNIIGNAKLTLNIELSNISLILSRQSKLLELLSELEGYRKLLETKVEKSTDKEESIEDIITNIVYLASQVDLNTKKEILDKVNYYLEEPRNNYQKELEKDLNCNVGLVAIKEVEPKQQLHLNLSNYLDEVRRKTKSIMPYVTLMNSLKDKNDVQKYVDDDGIISLINNIRYVILQFNDKSMQEKINIKFDEICNEWIMKIDNILLNGNECKNEYQKFEIDFRKDLQLFLEEINRCSIPNDLFKSLNICLSILNEEEMGEYRDTVETLLVKDILEAMDVDYFGIEKKNEVVIKLIKIINKYFEDLRYFVNEKDKDIEDIKKKLHMDLVGIKFKIDKYLSDKVGHDSIYIESNIEKKRLIKKKDTSIY